MRVITKKRKAAALISGGLDSMLAAKVMLEQGIHVEGLNFFSGFFGVGSKVFTLKKNLGKARYNNAQWIAKQLGIQLHVINIVDEFRDVLLNPKYGYGSAINPCLDCKIFIVCKALAWIKQHNFDFVITGEVIGQRPMSQRRDTMAVVKRDTCANGLLLRPLCARHLEPTIPEIQGWVDREKLFNFDGRSRKPQIALAKRYGFTQIPQPAGGCLLTEAIYAARLQNLWQVTTRRNYTLDDINLLKVGKHLCPRTHLHMIVGREERENQFLQQYADKFMHLFCVNHPGPLVLLQGAINSDDLQLAARITARFSKGRDTEKVLVQIKPLEEPAYQLEVMPDIDERKLQEWYIV